MVRLAVTLGGEGVTVRAEGIGVLCVCTAACGLTKMKTTIHFMSSHVRQRARLGIIDPHAAKQMHRRTCCPERWQGAC